MRHRIQNYRALLDHAFKLAVKADVLQEAVQERSSPQEINQLALDVVKLACEISISDLFQALKPPDELSDPASVPEEDSPGHADSETP